MAIFLVACSSGSRVSYTPTPKTTAEPAINRCLSNPEHCEDQWLCVRGTTQKDGKFIWDKRKTFKKYAKEAQRRGLSCGIVKAKANKVEPPKTIQRSNLGKILSSGLNRIRNLNIISQNQMEQITDIIKKMPQSKYDQLSRLCEIAYEELEPQQCDQRLKSLSN
jgi:hypothetical protein